MSKERDSWIDPGRRAADQLNSIIRSDFSLSDRESSRESPPSPLAETSRDTPIEVELARKEPSVIPISQSREKARLLLVTKDVTVFEEGSMSQRSILDMRGCFLEIHVVVLNQRLPKTEALSIVRVSENVWLYPTNSTSWWKLAYDGYKMGESQLVFSAGFRADVVVSEDVFEAGLAGWFLSKKYNRPFQLHVYEEFFEDEYVESQEHPMLYEWSLEYLLRHATSVRTKTELQRQAIIGEYPRLESVTEILPSYYNLDSWRDVEPTINLHEKYPRFKFILFHISSMRASSHSYDVIRGASKILRRYQTVGLVIVGNGPLRHTLERQAIALGLEKQIEFEPHTPDVLSYLKTANVYIHLSEDGGEDEFLLQAAVAKLPIIAHNKGIGETIFVDGESACLCAPDDVHCISESINRYLNENQERTRFGLSASEAVFDRIEQDYGAYLESYAQSVERCMISKG